MSKETASPTRYRLIVLLMLGMFSIAFHGASTANGQITTFENFSEGAIGGWFVDPTSGITFTNAIYNLGSGVFTVDYGGATNPPILPGKFMNVSVYSPGAPASFGAGPGFTFILPTPSTNVQMDQIYVVVDLLTPLSFNVMGYATNGQQVLNTNISLPRPSLGVRTSHSECVSTLPMSKVIVTTPSHVSVGFDNIGAPVRIESIFITNQTLVVTVKNARPQSFLLGSTNLINWSPISAVVSNDSGSMVFAAPIIEPHAFFRVQQ